MNLLEVFFVSGLWMCLCVFLFISSIGMHIFVDFMMFLAYSCMLFTICTRIFSRIYQWLYLKTIKNLCICTSFLLFILINIFWPGRKNFEKKNVHSFISGVCFFQIFLVDSHDYLKCSWVFLHAFMTATHSHIICLFSKLNDFICSVSFLMTLLFPWIPDHLDVCKFSTGFGFRFYGFLKNIIWG
jgi:hypothetical protein